LVDTKPIRNRRSGFGFMTTSAPLSWTWERGCSAARAGGSLNLPAPCEPASTHSHSGWRSSNSCGSCVQTTCEYLRTAIVALEHLQIVLGALHPPVWWTPSTRRACRGQSRPTRGLASLSLRPSPRTTSSLAGSWFGITWTATQQVVSSGERQTLSSSRRSISAARTRRRCGSCARRPV